MEATKKVRKKYTMSEAALAARRANIRKAHAAPKEKIYRPTQKRQAASRTNMEKAMAARKSPAGLRAARLNAATHGLFIKDLAASFRRMGEDPQEYRTVLALLQRLFVPVDEVEKECVRRLADASWKRLRLFRAQAVWELDRLKNVLKSVNTAKPPDAIDTYRRAVLLFDVFEYYFDYVDMVEQFQKRIAKEIHLLVAKRSQYEMSFDVVPRKLSVRKELDKLKLPVDKFVDQMWRELDKKS